MLVSGYNVELLGGVIHTDFWFGTAWGAFPVLPRRWPRPGRWPPPVLVAAGRVLAVRGAALAEYPARNIRRRAHRVEGSINYTDGRTDQITADTLLQPLERALRAASW